MGMEWAHSRMQHTMQSRVRAVSQFTGRQQSYSKPNVSSHHRKDDSGLELTKPWYEATIRVLVLPVAVHRDEVPHHVLPTTVFD